jgi:hypothetical protein
MQYKKLWIFGPSLCLPWLLDDPAQGWPALLSKQLDIPVVNNYGTSSVDNFYIYQSVLKRLPEIGADDLLVVGWSHPNRKMFVVDQANPEHTSTLKTSLHFVDGENEFMRSDLPTPDSGSKWSLMKPRSSGNKFYDTWFKHYFSEYEQRINFQAYYDSVQLRAPCKYLPIYFSQESVNGVDVVDTAYYLDFVLEHRVQLSETDFHLNVKGHSLFTNLLNSLVHTVK